MKKLTGLTMMSKIATRLSNFIRKSVKISRKEYMDILCYNKTNLKLSVLVMLMYKLQKLQLIKITPGLDK